VRRQTHFGKGVKQKCRVRTARGTLFGGTRSSVRGCGECSVGPRWLHCGAWITALKLQRWRGATGTVSRSGARGAACTSTLVLDNDSACSDDTATTTHHRAFRASPGVRIRPGSPRWRAIYGCGRHPPAAAAAAAAGQTCTCSRACARTRSLRGARTRRSLRSDRGTVPFEFVARDRSSVAESWATVTTRQCAPCCGRQIALPRRQRTGLSWFGRAEEDLWSSPRRASVSEVPACSRGAGAFGRVRRFAFARASTQLTAKAATSFPAIIRASRRGTLPGASSPSETPGTLATNTVMCSPFGAAGSRWQRTEACGCLG